MKKISFLLVFILGGLFSFGQSTTATFGVTGGPQSWTVPPCVGTVTITVAGGQGSTIGGATGGQGAVITITMNVTPGDNFSMLVGGQGQNPGAGFNGGGIGYAATNGNALHNSGGGGGATNLSYNGSLIAVAAGGGGAGGGSVNNNGGGAGGCANGSPGGNTYGAGGSGASQVAGGNGGAPWAGVPPGGQAGSAGQGGQGGLWVTASGGGGGGGYFGGGGGGNDGCCTGANGGGGGGGGSSLVPAGSGCTGGSNSGPGYVSITWGCENVPPTASNPASINVECVAQVPVPDINVVTDALDNCDPNPVVAFVGDVSDGMSCPETITRTYSVTDSCLNQILVTQSIIIQDITPPTATNPPGGFIVCSADMPPVDITIINDEADNCAMPIVVAHVSDISDGNICPEIITRTYSVTDGCGNSIDIVQIFTVHDNIAPTASNPLPITVSCLSDVPVPSPNAVTDEADNCTLPITVAHVSDVSNGSSCNGEIITRTYSVTDACGNSINVTQQIFIDAFIPTIGAGIDQTVCEGVQVKLIAANPDGAAISWDQGVVDGSLFNSPIGTTNYTVTANICNGECIATDNVDVRVNLLPVIDFESDTLIGCEPLTAVFSNYSTEQNACVWNFGDGHVVNGCGPVSNNYKIEGIYDVTLTVTSIEGCVSTATYDNYIEVIAMPEARFQASDITVTFDDPRVKFTNNSLHANSYAWSFGDSTTSALISPTHDFPTHREASYLVTLTASNFLGCSHSTSQVIYVEDVLIYYIPNTFTPDGDAYNESFKPIFTEGVNIYDYHFMIFNRWGEIMFESYNTNNGWNGHYGDGGLVEDGTYIWQVDFSETGVDNRHKVNGHVTVLK